MRQGNSWSIGYTYRADGLIASRAKTIYIYNPRTGQWTPMGLTPTRFYHDGSEPLFEESGPLNAPSIAAINVRGPDGLVARKQGATWTYYTFDQQGNVSQRLDSSGAVVSSSVYDAYGAETTTGTAPTDACGYNAQWGYWLDRDTGLYLCQARWYDPVTGRWVTRDPIGYAGGANLYGYCGGSPVGRMDDAGLERVLIIVGPEDKNGVSTFDIAVARLRKDIYELAFGYSVRILLPDECGIMDAELGERDLIAVEVIAHAGRRNRPEARVAGSAGTEKRLAPSARSTLLTPERILEARNGVKLELLSLCSCDQGAPGPRLRAWSRAAQKVISYRGGVTTRAWHESNWPRGFKAPRDLWVP